MTVETKSRAVPAAIAARPAEKVGMRVGNRKNVGAAVPLTYYNLFGIEPAIRNEMRPKTWTKTGRKLWSG